MPASTMLSGAGNWGGSNHSVESLLSKRIRRHSDGSGKLPADAANVWRDIELWAAFFLCNVNHNFGMFCACSDRNIDAHLLWLTP